METEVVYVLFDRRKKFLSVPFYNQNSLSIFVHLRACHSPTSGSQDYWRPLFKLFEYKPLSKMTTHTQKKKKTSQCKPIHCPHQKLIVWGLCVIWIVGKYTKVLCGCGACFNKFLSREFILSLNQGNHSVPQRSTGHSNWFLLCR